MGIFNFIFGKKKEPEKKGRNRNSRRVAASRSQSAEQLSFSTDKLEALFNKIESLENHIQKQASFDKQNQEHISALLNKIASLENQLNHRGANAENQPLKTDIPENNDEGFRGQKTETFDSIVLDKDNKKFYQAWNLIEKTNNSVFLTGKAGTGKTTFLKYLIHNTKKQHIVLSPTGVAAVNAGGVTIHSFFKLGFQPYLPKDKNLSKDNLKYWMGKIEVIRALELIIIDEISMVRSDVLEAVSRILQIYRGNNLPFGGVQMVFIGDLFQLAPIADANIWENLKDYYASEYFFDAPVLKSMPYYNIELDKIYRQTDRKFIDLLNQVRVGKLDKAGYDFLNQRYIGSNRYLNITKGHIVLTSHRYKADMVNRYRLNALPSDSHQFEATIIGKFNERDEPVDKLLDIRVGAQVMLAKNNLPTYYNGSMGIVESIGKEQRPSNQLDENLKPVMVEEYCIRVKLFDSNQTVAVFGTSWYKYEYEFDKQKKEVVGKVVGEFIQFPIRLAWAMTIHKSQGLTFDKVIVDAEQAFAHGQTYVALSRCRSLEGLILKSPIPPESIIVDNRVVEFLENFKQSRIN